MNGIICKTWYANIYLGLQESYDGPIHTIEEIYDICQEYCDKVGLGLTVTETMFIYTKGNEPGAIIGLINYPRFPSSEITILNHAMNLAEKLKTSFNQERCSIMTPDITYMLGEK